MPRPPYGYCPHCRTAGTAETNGIISCSQGHQYSVNEALSSIPRSDAQAPATSPNEGSVPEGFVKARKWGEPLIPVGETFPQQPQATTATPAAPTLPSAATPVAGVPPIPALPTSGPSNILEYAGAIEARQNALDARIRQLVGWLQHILFELEGYLPENQNTQKVAQSTEKEGETSVKLPKKGEKADSTGMTGVVKPAAGDLDGPSEEDMKKELAGLLSEDGESETNEKQAPTEETMDTPAEEDQDPAASADPVEATESDPEVEDQDEGQNGPDPSEPISPKGDSP